MSIPKLKIIKREREGDQVNAFMFQGLLSRVH